MLALILKTHVLRTKSLVFQILGLALGLAKRPCGVVLWLVGLALGLLRTFVFRSRLLPNRCFPDVGFGPGPREAALRRCFVVVGFGPGPVENPCLQIQKPCFAEGQAASVLAWASLRGLAARS